MSSPLKRCALALLPAILAACGDSTGPQPPTALDLAVGAQRTVDRITGDTTLTSLLVLAREFAFRSPSPATPMGPRPAGPVPAQALGKTYAWSTAIPGYLLDPALSGAPAAGARFRLYAVTDGSATSPDLPLRDIGYVDLANDTAGAWDAFTVRLYSGADLLADYRVTALTSSTQIDVHATGDLATAEGTIGFDLEHRLGQLSWRFLHTLTDASGLEVDLDLTLTGSLIAADYHLRRGGTVVHLFGNLTATSSDVQVSVNGVATAHLTGDPSSPPTITGVGGRQLTPEELEAFSTAFDEMLRLPFAPDRLFAPAYRFY